MIINNNLASFGWLNMLIWNRVTSCWSALLLPPIFSNYRKSFREDDADFLINLNNRRLLRTSMPLLCVSLPSTGQWSATGKTIVVRNLTTHPWILGVLVQHPTLHAGWNPLLHMRWPSRPRAAPRTCVGRTRTRTWPQSPCSDSPGRSVSRCDSGGRRPRHVNRGLTRGHFTAFPRPWSMFLSE